jgi:16S rRNA (cytosine1402-N4)-methyltransferase
VRQEQIEHIPVLSKQLAEQVILPPDGVMVDATIGQGGHSYLFGQTLGPQGILIGLDLDEKGLEKARERLKTLNCRVILIHANFSQIGEELQDAGIKKADFILADLGVSSSQLAEAQFGLSFTEDMPLDMRIDKRIQRSAADIVNYLDEKSLADLIYRYGEERASRRIARFIVESRKGYPITTTGRLAGVVCKALGSRAKGRRSRIHPATRTFQALRIVVNGELENLEALLNSAPQVLKVGGRIAVISFHSLEDRLVKNNFRKNKEKKIYEIVTKKPLIPTRQEVSENRRSRSAKLRIARKISEED